MKRTTLILAGIAYLAVCAPSLAACPERIVISGGTATAEAIANACGINVETLKSANPGMTGDRLEPGTHLKVPRPSMPTPMLDIGRPLVQIAPSMVPNAPGASGSTVILPPVQPPIPQQHILRGFGDQPGQLPLPPGHSPPTFGQPFIVQ